MGEETGGEGQQEGRRGESDRGRSEVDQSIEERKKGLAVEDFHFPAAKPCYSKALKLWTQTRS